MRRKSLPKKSFLTIAVSSLAAGSIALIAPPVQAQAQTSGGGGTGGYVLPTTGGGNAGESGRDSSSAQLIGAAANIGAAAMYMSICPTMGGSWACPLAGLASVAASLLGNASKGSSAAGGSMSAFDPTLYGPGGPGTGTGNGTAKDPDVIYDNGGIGANGTGLRLPDGTTPQTIARDVARIRSGLEQAGVTISPDGQTMTTKDGRKFDLGASGDGSISGLMAMGLSASEAAQADAAGKKYAAANASKFANMAKLGADGGGGGAAGRGPAGEDAAGGGFNFNFNDPRNKKRAAAKVSGLTRKLGDDTIGVSGDNIFEMVTRRYKARDQVNNFLKD